MSNAPIGLQLFAVRGEVKEDLAGTLEQVAAIGYAAVEPWGYGGDAVEWLGHSGTEIRKMLDDNGLKACGMHVATGALVGDNLARTVELNQQLGNRFLIVAADKQRMSSAASITELAAILNDTAEKLKAHGMFTGYHAHGFDFADVDGTVAWYRLFSQTRDDVIMQMDVGNCAGGGGDPIDALKTFPGRARSVHLKDYNKPENGVIGDGDADWNEIFRICDTRHPVEWYVVEEGGRDGLGFDIPQRSLEALRAMGR